MQCSVLEIFYLRYSPPIHKCIVPFLKSQINVNRHANLYGLISEVIAKAATVSGYLKLHAPQILGPVIVQEKLAVVRLFPDAAVGIELTLTTGFVI